MEAQEKTFVLTWLMACLASLLLVVGLGVLSDPYLVFNAPRILGFNARKPAAATQERLIKAYDALRNDSRTLILGTSRVDLGLDPADPAWPAGSRPVYNLAISGAGPYVSYRYLQHVMAHRHIGTVLLGLDFQLFLSAQEAEHPTSEELESRLAVNADGSLNAEQNRRRLLDMLESTLSYEGIEDSIATIQANFTSDSNNLSAGALSLSPLFRATRVTDSYRRVLSTDLAVIRHYAGTHLSARVMADVRAILELCRARHTQVILFISPEHADGLEILDTLGLWDSYEDWKRALVSLTQQYREPGDEGTVPLWDFSGYDDYSTEEVFQASRPLMWFWDSLHYNRALGHIMVARMFGIRDEGHPQYGTLLDPNNEELHLQEIRAQRIMYRSSHQRAVDRVHYLYHYAVSRMPPSRQGQ